MATVALDRLVADFELPLPNHLKIDVDGGEVRVLRGARQVLRDRRLQTVLIEVDDEVRPDVTALIEAAGLRLRTDLRAGTAAAPGYALFERA
jgi:hypothetical protein